MRKLVACLGLSMLTIAVGSALGSQGAGWGSGQDRAGVSLDVAVDPLDPELVVCRVVWLQAAALGRLTVRAAHASRGPLVVSRDWSRAGDAWTREWPGVEPRGVHEFVLDLRGTAEGTSAFVMAERVNGPFTHKVLVRVGVGAAGVVVFPAVAYRLTEVAAGAAGGVAGGASQSGVAPGTTLGPTAGAVLVESLATAVPTKAEVFREEYASAAIADNSSCIPGSSWSVNRWIDIASAPTAAVISTLTIHVTVTHPVMADVEVGFFKDSQSGNFLWNRGSGVNLDATYVNRDYYNQILPAVGGPVNGVYNLTARDCAALDTGTLDYWSVRVEYASAADVDLEADSFAVSPSDIAPGGQVAATYFGHVEGTGSVGSSFSLGFYLSTDTTIDGSDGLLDRVTESVASDPGDSFGLGSPGRTLTIPSGTVAGSYWVGFVVDDTGVVAESDEGNNIVWAPLTVNDPHNLPNIEAVSCSVSPSSADAGDDVEFTWRGRNSGSSGSGDFVWGVYLSSDATIDPAADDGVLGLDVPGGWPTGYDTSSWPNTVTLDPSLADGQYWLGVYLDTGDAVAESNESDNWCAAPLTVGAGGSATCTEDASTLCLNDDRFKVTANWATAGDSGVATAVELTDDTGYFWFFNHNNVEVVIKVLDGCPVNGRYWVFAGGLTNVQVNLRVEDTQEGGVTLYQNPLSTQFQPIQDTGAFATCP